MQNYVLLWHIDFFYYITVYSAVNGTLCKGAMTTQIEYFFLMNEMQYIIHFKNLLQENDRDSSGSVYSLIRLSRTRLSRHKPISSLFRKPYTLLHMLF